MSTLRRTVKSMSTKTVTRTKSLVPEWTLADRLRKAREHAELEQLELSEISGISRAAISNAERGSTSPHRSTLMLWAMATGVSLNWLLTGEADEETNEAPSDEDGASNESRLRDLNPRPVLYEGDDFDPDCFALAS